MNLVELEPLLQAYNPTFDLRYATMNNVTGRILEKNPIPRLEEVAAYALVKATESFAQRGFRVVIWDAYRQNEVHQQLLEFINDRRYVLEDSNHPKGRAVDLTLAQPNGQQLDMGTDYDDFTETAHVTTTSLSPQQSGNRLILTAIMTRAGFTRYPFEWWHFDYTQGVER